MSKPKKAGRPLPGSLFEFRNPEKEGRERWTRGRDLLNLPRPYRMLLCGPPSSGKTLFILNVLARATPLWEEGWVLHFGGEGSPEYAKSGLQPIDELPDPLSIPDDGVQRVLVIEDMCFAQLSKSEKATLDRLYGYTSSHRNLTIIMTVQDPFSAPPCCRRLCNAFVVYPQCDTSSLAQLASRTGMTAGDFAAIFRDLVRSNHDSLMIDLTENTPARLRLNGLQRIEDQAAATPVGHPRRRLPTPGS